MRRRFQLGIMLLGLCKPALACWCQTQPLCDQLPQLSGHAVFTGRVVDVWPSEKSLVAEDKVPISQLRREFLDRWRGVLSREEEVNIAKAPNRIAMEWRVWLMQRVRFETVDSLIGPAVHEIYTDISSCGVHFKVGETYLVNASPSGLRYETGACMRTGLVSNAADDIAALKAWKAGKPQLPRIYGQISDHSLGPGIELRLRGGGTEHRISLDPQGRFSFDGLRHIPYTLEVSDTRGTASKRLDLTSRACFEPSVFFSDSWLISESP